jgi:VIT1/CCC1 family predicted Fe2+/Mn2+ transporter
MDGSRGATYMLKMSRISYGGTAAAVTSTALVSGLSAADAARPIIVSALLIAALADNLIDALSIHVFQESERLDQKDALTGTITNFAARLLLCGSFVALVVFLPLAQAAAAAIVWGIALLAALTYLVARERGVRPMPEVFKHLLVAAAAIIVSNGIGHGIGAVLR